MFSINNSLFIYILGATTYSLIEILWRGYSHISMFFIGGFCFLLLYKLSSFPYPIALLALIGSIIITFVELCGGLIFNKILHLSVWDYSQMPLNFMGQICVSYSFAWFFLSFIAIILFRKFF